MAATFIAPDTYTGKHTTFFNPKAHRVARYNASELIAFGREGSFFESMGRMRNGKELFTRTRYVADDAGNLHCYAANGSRTIIHPADRVLRILTGK